MAEAIGAWLVIIAVVLFLIGAGGAMNDSNNRYPGYFIGIAMVLGVVAEWVG